MISVDTKKKELVGDFRKNGREYQPQGRREEVRVQDFLIRNSAERRPMASMIRPRMLGG